MSTLWEAEIIAYGLYPKANGGEQRRLWVESVHRSYADQWTRNVCPLPSAPLPQYYHWQASNFLFSSADKRQPLREHENRDAIFTSSILLQCLLSRMSRAAVTERIAETMRTAGTTNSSDSAQQMLKRAWRRYCPGAHIIAAWRLLNVPGPLAVRDEEAFIKLSSLAEHIRRQAEAFIPPHGRHPILDPVATWKLPGNLPLLDVTLFDIEGESIRIGFEPPHP